MNRAITDAGVAGLPIHEGRAELLEEIMATTPRETARPQSAPERTRRRALPALAAAAAVLAVAGGAAWLGQGADDVAPIPVADGRGSGELAALTLPGWNVTHVDADPNGGEISYRKGRTGEQTLDIMWRPAAQYDSYVADRNDLGTPVEVDLLGTSSLMWAYGERDHTVIRPAGEEFSLEVRGAGMDEAAFRGLLAQLHPADRAAVAELAGRVRPDSDDAPPSTDAEPLLIRAAGWSPGMESGNIFWERPGGARILVVTVGGVDDPFAYDRYLDADVRKEVTALGQFAKRALLAEWRQDGVRYRAVVSSLVGGRVLILEGTGLSRKELLDVVASAEWVTAAEYEEALRDGGSTGQ